ncbi:Histidine kinase-, DNA gyrase B-, and HSP90-like ATPase [Mucilaginibacter pineti]|uniref:histidine kinase n=1 Tax=Mucilaginibacter pineti TaxID=1391627 RepID=A0A1G7AFB3_9SPHI|nr:sensor histidine kinase [Mucilaginibacter pineti]SDE13499.1 Histidine kinase-, DNA gyrase B-, and HSP90-like ATPase [Mucilaginibacter pineti]
MQTTENSLIPVLIIGTLVVVVLITCLFFFVIIYQRKMIKNQTELRALHDERQSELMSAVFETQESERKRLAEDLHDSVGQVLSAIKLNLHRLDKNCISETTQPLLMDTRKLTDECIQEIRNIIHNVLPPVLTDYGLLVALEALSNKVEQTTHIKVKFSKKIADQRFPHDIELALYRIAQELFGNAIKHSDATVIYFTITHDAGMLVMEFKDNGVGFNLGEVKQGFGIKNLESRVQLINGDINIYSKPLSGTLTTIKLKIA